VPYSFLLLPHRPAKKKRNEERKRERQNCRNAVSSSIITWTEGGEGTKVEGAHLMGRQRVRDDTEGEKEKEKEQQNNRPGTKERGQALSKVFGAMVRDDVRKKEEEGERTSRVVSPNHRPTASPGRT